MGSQGMTSNANSPTLDEAIFESAWRQGQRPQTSMYMEHVPTVCMSPLMAEPSISDQAQAPQNAIDLMMKLSSVLFKSSEALTFGPLAVY